MALSTRTITSTGQRAVSLPRSSARTATPIGSRAQQNDNSGNGRPPEKNSSFSPAEGDSSSPQSSQSGAAPSAQTRKSRGFNDVMAFTGWAPERINGRLAMIGFLAGLGAELSTGQSVPYQFTTYFTSFAIAAGVFSLASFVPSFFGSSNYMADPRTMSKGNIVGPFTEQAELFNGRMVGFASMLLIESYIKNGPLFA